MRILLITALLALSFPLYYSIPIFAEDGTVDESFNVNLETTRFLEKRVDQIVALPGGKMFVIGRFNRYNGQPVGGFIRLNADATLDPTFANTMYSGIGPTVGSVLPLPDGKFLLTGQPRLADGSLHPRRFVRMNSDGTIDSTYTVEVSGVIWGSAVDPSGRLLVSGHLDVVRNGETVHENFVRFTADGQLDPSFDADPNVQLEGPIAVWNDKILFIDLVANNIRMNRLNGDGTLDQSFVPKAIPHSFVLQIVVQDDGKILVRSGSTILRLNDDATLDAGFNLPAELASVNTRKLELMPDGRITTAYLSMSPYGVRFVRLLPSGAYDSSFTPYFYADSVIESEALAVQSDGGIVIGDFAIGNTSNRFMRLTPSGAVDISFNAGGTGFLSVVEGKVRAIHVMPDQKIMIGGDFQRVNNIDRSRIARINPDGSLDPNFQITVGGTGNVFIQIEDIYGIIRQPDGKLLVNGAFSYRINGLTKTHIVRLNADGSIDPTFNLNTFVIDYFGPNGWGKNKLVLDSANRVTVGSSHGEVTEAWKVPMRFNPDGTRDTSFAPTLFSGLHGSTIFDLEIQPDGKLLIAGRKYANDERVGFVHRLNPDGSIDSSFTSYEVSGPDIFAFELLESGKIIIDSKTNTQSSILRLNANGTVDPTFQSGTGANGKINDVESLADGKLLVAGLFSTYNGSPRQNFAVLGPDGELDPFTADVNNEVLTIALDPDDRILLGGNFTAINATNQQYNRSYIVRMRAAGSPATSVRTPFDFDGDRKADLAVRRPSDDFWYIQNSNTGFTGMQWGVEGDKPAPADYDGDGRTDIAVFRPGEGTWYIVMSASRTLQSFNWGETGDQPVPADHNGDGRADLVVYRGTDNIFYKASISTGPFDGVQFGVAGDKPQIGDFDGDAKADVAVFRPSDNNWYVLRSTGGFTALQFGEAGDVPVPADYDGDGSTDPAVYRPSTGYWYMVRSGSSGYDALSWGIEGDIPAPADYDGDGKADPAVFRPSDGVWHLHRSAAGITGVQFGQAGDLPVPAAFIY